MSRISELRNKKSNCVNIVKILELFCNEETKYIEMLVKLLPTYGDSIGIKVNAISVRTGIDSEKIKQLSHNEIEVLYNFTENILLMSNIKSFKRFCELNEQKQIDKNDLHSYKTFDEIENAVSDAEEKIRIKELEKQINKIYEDEDWLILIPLTYQASVKYGYGTKWCTASESTDIQYKSYTKDGVLIYVIHKGIKKIAVYKRHNENEISFWNEKDKKTDSFQFNLPIMILEKIRETINEKDNEYSNIEIDLPHKEYSDLPHKEYSDLPLLMGNYEDFRMDVDPGWPSQNVIEHNGLGNVKKSRKVLSDEIENQENLTENTPKWRENLLIDHVDKITENENRLTAEKFKSEEYVNKIKQLMSMLK